MNANSAESQTLIQEHCKPLYALACHPKIPILAMGSHGGVLKVWDYEQKMARCSRVFEEEKQIQVMTFDPQG